MLNITSQQLIDAVDGELINGNIDKYGRHRIKRVSYDSRDVDEETLFVAIIGEKINPHKFVPKMLDESQCVISLVQEDVPDYIGDKLLVKVEDTTIAIQKLARICRSKINVPVIGITGSVGKTTTRQFISLALSAGRKVYATPGNRNSQIGTPLTLFEYDETAEIAVLEMGMSMPGEMSRLANMVRPDAVVFTNIGVTHIENLGSREAILNEKMHILDYANDGTNVFLNADNDLLSSVKVDGKYNAIYYGINDKRGVYAKNVDLSQGYAEFVACVNGKEVAVKLNVYGVHQIYNALVALAVADSFNIDLEAAADKLSTYAGFAHRNQIFNHDGITLIDDTYNAAPDSMRAAIDMLGAINCSGRRIAVLADMKELGDIAISEHKAIGEYARSRGNIDMIVTYGELAKNIAIGFGEKQAIVTDSHEELEDILCKNLNSNDVVLFKGSNSMNLFDIVDKVMKHEFM